MQVPVATSFPQILGIAAAYNMCVCQVGLYIIENAPYYTTSPTAAFSLPIQAHVCLPNC